MVKAITYASILSVIMSVAAYSAQTQPTDSTKSTMTSSVGIQNSLRQDPQIVQGKLANGLTYYIRPNAEPKGRLSIRMRVNVGSLCESEKERGLSHFMEHMVFNGSENFKENELVPSFQRLGVMFGRDINAYTSFDETVYMVDMPNLKPETVDLSMKLFHDFAGTAKFDAKALDSERGVIMNELKTRDSGDYRIMKQMIGYMFEGLNHINRMPIGLEEVITKTKRDVFVDYYKRHYAPDQITMVLVGDITVEQGKELLEKYMGGLKPSGEKSDANVGSLKNQTAKRAKIIIEEESPATKISLFHTTPYEKVADTPEQRLKDLPLTVACSMLSRRLQILQKSEDCPYLNAEIKYDDFLRAAHIFSAEATCRPEQWKPTLNVLEQELRRGTEFGFTPAELKEAKSKIIQSYEQSVATWGTTPSNNLASRILDQVGDHKVATTPEEELRILRPALEKLTTDDCLAALKKVWNSQQAQLLASGTVKINGGEKELLEAFNTSESVAVTAPTATSEASFAYSHVGNPGKIISKNEIKDLGITQIKLSNGVIVNYKKTDFQNDTIHVSARVDGGKVTYPSTKPGLDSYASTIMNAGGLEAHSIDDLERILADKNVGIGFSIDEKCFTLSGSTNRKDMDCQMELLCAYLMHPGFRKEGDITIKRALPAMYERLSKESEGVFKEKLLRTLTKNDPRFSFPSYDEINSFTIDDVRSWVSEPLKKNALEINIIGDFDTASLEKCLEKTFAALPQRETTPKSLNTKPAPIQYAPQGQDLVFTYPTSMDKAMTSVIWKAYDSKDKVRALKMSILGKIMSNRIHEKIREEMGDAYSPMGYFDMSDTFDNFGYYLALSPGTDENSERVAAALIDLGKGFETKPITKDEMNRTLLPILATFDKSMRDNDFWLSSGLENSQYEPAKLDRLRKTKATLEATTPEELTQLAQEIFKPERATKFRVVPASPKETSSTKSETAAQ